MAFEPVKDPVLEWPLETPVVAHGETISTIAFRKPTAADIVAVGNPVKFVPFDPTSEPSIVDDRMAPMLARLAGVNLAAITGMDPGDYNACAWNLAGFFIARPWKRTSTSPST